MRADGQACNCGSCGTLTSTWESWRVFPPCSGAPAAHGPTAGRTRSAPVPSTDCWTHSTKKGEKEFSRYITPFLYTYNIQVPKCCNVVVWCSSRSWVAGAVENSGTVASQTPRRGQFLLHRWTDACLRCTAASWVQVQEEERVQSWTRLHCRR